MGQRIWTAEEIERMTPEERRKLFESRVVTDLSQVPEDFLERVRTRAEKLIKDTDPNTH